uniref:Uncharacterized protein n=1 Tax=Aegilops tauschii subsp. strangulata TaxID=200361 RepID=A0A453R2H4_AEGTS
MVPLVPSGRQRLAFPWVRPALWLHWFHGDSSVVSVFCLIVVGAMGVAAAAAAAIFNPELSPWRCSPLVWRRQARGWWWLASRWSVASGSVGVLAFLSDGGSVGWRSNFGPRGSVDSASSWILRQGGEATSASMPVSMASSPASVCSGDGDVFWCGSVRWPAVAF